MRTNILKLIARLFRAEKQLSPYGNLRLLSAVNGEIAVGILIKKVEADIPAGKNLYNSLTDGQRIRLADLYEQRINFIDVLTEEFSTSEEVLSYIRIQRNDTKHITKESIL